MKKKQKHIKKVFFNMFGFWIQKLIDSVLNNTWRIVTGCLRPTPTGHLPILSGIQPAELCRMGATLSLAYRKSLNPDHILYSLLSGSSDTRQVRLRSIANEDHQMRLKSMRLRLSPFAPAARNLLDNLARLGIRASEWTNHKWKTEYCEGASRLQCFCVRDRCQACWDGLTPSSLG